MKDSWLHLASSLTDEVQQLLGLFRFWRKHKTLLELLFWYILLVTEMAVPIEWGLRKMNTLSDLVSQTLAIRTSKPTLMRV